MNNQPDIDKTIQSLAVELQLNTLQTKWLEAAINTLIKEARIDELHKYRVEHAKHHDEEYCLDNFNNFNYIHDRIASLENKEDK